MNLGFSPKSPRPITGRKRKSQQERILEGSLMPPERFEYPENLGEVDISKVPEIYPEMIEKQRENMPELRAEEIYKECNKYYVSLKVNRKIPPELLRRYSMALARYWQCEAGLNKYGMVARTPAGDIKVNPFHTMCIDLGKRADLILAEINQSIRQNGGTISDKVGKKGLIEHLTLNINNGVMNKN